MVRYRPSRTTPSSKFSRKHAIALKRRYASERGERECVEEEGEKRVVYEGGLRRLKCGDLGMLLLWSGIERDGRKRVYIGVVIVKEMVIAENDDDGTVREQQHST